MKKKLRRTHLAKSLKKTEFQSQYDACAKKLLSDKQVLARIMKHTVQEFRNMTVDDIVCCIEEDAEVSCHPLYDDTVSEKITGMNTDSNIVGEGSVTFDIRFYAFIPGKERTKFILNIEAQKDYQTGYSFGSRGVFYCARMISEQLDTEFSVDNYDDIKKVYSIWICMNSPEKYANTISQYSMQEQDLYGHFVGKENYDLLAVVIIRLLENEGKAVKNDLINMLNILLSMKLDADTKQNLLETNYNMKMTKEMKGDVKIMSNIGEWAYEQIEKEVTEKVTKDVTDRVTKDVTDKVTKDVADTLGRKITYEKLIESVDNIIQAFETSLEKACEVQKTTVEEYYLAKKFLGVE